MLADANLYARLCIAPGMLDDRVPVVDGSASICQRIYIHLGNIRPLFLI